MTPHFDAIGIVVSDMGRSLRFYRRLGLAMPDSPGEGHVEVELPGAHRLLFDTEDTIRSFDPSWSPPGPGGHRIGLAFACDRPDDVDTAVSELTASGASVHLAPFDAPWGMRYATVLDPDGNAIDLFAAR